MSYIRPSPGAVNLSWQGKAAYIRPNANNVAMAFAPSVVEGVGAVTLAITADAVGTHSTGAGPTTGTGDVTLSIAAAASGAHGVSGTCDVTLSIAAAASGAHGVSGTGSATLTVTPAAAGVHTRYELRGEVRQGGILVNRRVRAYLRSTGALVGEGDTVAGLFHLHTGFAEAEHYVVPIHLDATATDWLPPVANRVLSVLAQDS